MYEKIGNSDFNVIDHYNSKIKETNIEDEFKTVYMGNTPKSKEVKQKERKIERTNYKHFKYDEFLKINNMHKEYLDKLKGSMNCSAFLAHLYKAELTGAMLSFKTNGKTKSGIVVEERENVLIIIHENDVIRMYPKINHCFILEHQEVKYFLIGKGMHKNRFLKK